MRRAQLVHELEGKDNIRVLVDRRMVDRRKRETPRREDRRGDDRRARAHTDSQLRSLGWSIIRFEGD